MNIFFAKFFRSLEGKSLHQIYKVFYFRDFERFFISNSTLFVDAFFMNWLISYPHRFPCHCRPFAQMEVTFFRVINIVSKQRICCFWSMLERVPVLYFTQGKSRITQFLYSRLLGLLLKAVNVWVLICVDSSNNGTLHLHVLESLIVRQR